MERETELLTKINEPLPPKLKRRYTALRRRLRAEIITPDEHAELIGLTEQIQWYDLKRVEALVELAQLRQTSLTALMDDLGIEAPPPE